jgi:hypothetical protein
VLVLVAGMLHAERLEPSSRLAAGSVWDQVDDPCPAPGFHHADVADHHPAT